MKYEYTHFAWCAGENGFILKLAQHSKYLKLMDEMEDMTYGGKIIQLIPKYESVYSNSSSQTSSLPINISEELYDRVNSILEELNKI